MGGTMSAYIPPSIIEQLARAIPRVESGELTMIQAGEFLTGLLGHPDYDAITDERVLDILDELGPDLELGEFGPSDVAQQWREITKLLEEILGEGR